MSDCKNDDNKNEDAEAQICLQCGAMHWLFIPDKYCVEYHVKEGGLIEVEEHFDTITYECAECGTRSALLGLKCNKDQLKELAELNPEERILRALEWLADGLTSTEDDVTFDDIVSMVECFAIREEQKGRGYKEEFVAKAKEIIGRWKMLEG